jgi:hypothetical protein
MSKSDKDNFKGDHIYSLTAYAYALAGDHQAAFEILNKKINHGYKSENRFKKHYSMYVQAMSYIILTKTLIGQDPKEQVEWLLEYRNADGAFYSPFDTVLALQALYEYTKYKNYQQIKYTLRIDGNDTHINPSESISYILLSPNIKLRTINQYLGYMNLYQNYYDNSAQTNIISNVETIVKKGNPDTLLDITVKYSFKTPDPTLGNSIIALEVELPVGYEHYNLQRETVGYRNNGTTLVFHYNDIQKAKIYNQKILVKENKNVVKYHKPLTIKFYDYYRPSKLTDFLKFRLIKVFYLSFVDIQDIYKYDVLCKFN